MDERPDLEITRVRSGGSARIGAVVLAAALIGVVWIGVSGRQTPAPVAVLPSAPSRPSDSPTRAPRLPPPSPITTPAPTPGVADTYGASLAIGNVRYVTILSELQPGHLSGELHFPSPPRLPEGTLQFSELWKDGHVEAAVAIGEWTVDLTALGAATRTPAEVVAASLPPQVTLLDVPPPVTRGYRINVAGSNDLLFTRLSIDVVLGERPHDSSAEASVRFGVSVDAGGVHRAVIMEPSTNDSFKGSFTMPKPRRATNAQLHLYNVQLTVSHDIWSEIASFNFKLTPEMARVPTTKLITNESTSTYKLVARTDGNVRGQLITVTVFARRVTAAE